MNQAAQSPSRPPTKCEMISFVSASIAVQVHVSPAPSMRFFIAATFFCLAPASQGRPKFKLRHYRKLQSVSTRTYFVRLLEPSDRLGARKSREISLSAIACKISLSFRTASVDSDRPVAHQPGT